MKTHSQSGLKFGFIFVVLYLFVITSLHAQWSQLNGPAGSEVKSIAVSGTNLFAGTSSGVFLSTNKGSSWVSVNTGLSYTNVENLFVDGMILYAIVVSPSFATTVFRTTNNGVNWINSGLPSTFSATSFAASSTNLFVGGGNGLYRSTNNGTNWILVYNGFENYSIRSLVMSGTYLYAGTYYRFGVGGGAIFKSSNYGASWSVFYTAGVNTFAISGTNVFAGTQSGIFRSNNIGTTWVSAGMSNQVVRSLAVKGTDIYSGIQSLGFSGDVYRSSNNGMLWTEASAGLNRYHCKALSVLDNDLFASSTQFSGDGYGGLFRSTNDGITWVETGLPNAFVSCISVSGKKLIAGTQGGIYLTTNYGTTWTVSYSSQTNNDIVALSVSENNYFAGIYSGSIGILRSTNNGSNWFAANGGLTNTSVRAFAVSGSNLFVGTWGGGVFISTNNGEYWNDVNSGLTNTNVLTFVVLGSNLFAGTLGGGVFLSTNNGVSWNDVNSGLTSLNVICLVESSNHLFAGTQNNGVFISTNNGSSWTQSSLSNRVIYSLVAYGNNIFAGSSNGVYVSNDYGNSWIIVNEGLGVQKVSALGIHNNYIYAGTDGKSVYRRSLSEVIGIQPISTEVPDKYSLFQNYPNPFNPSTKIKFDIKKSGLVKLMVYDILGKEVTTLVNEKLSAGSYETYFDGVNFTSGIYFYRIETGDYSEVKRMIFVK